MPKPLIASALLLSSLFLMAAAPVDAEVEEYAGLVTGHFTSLAQHKADDRYGEVEADVTRIWPEKTDGIWLYQEQAFLTGTKLTRAEAKKTPYFQRIVHIYRADDGRIGRDVYSLTDPKAMVGMPRPFTSADLGEKGCPTQVERVAAKYYLTLREDCPNSWKGAVRLSSRNVTTPEGYANWDRGMDANGKQVWGPDAGGYIFLRKKPGAK
jgi:hypothetical protein